MRATYTPGRGVALITDRLVALIDGDNAGELAGRLLDLADEGGGADELTRLLASASLAALPSFAAVTPGSDAVQVFVRGTAGAIVDGEHLEAAGDVPWARQAITGDRATLLLGEAPTEPARLWCSRGLVPACAVDVEPADLGGWDDATRSALGYLTSSVLPGPIPVEGSIVLGRRPFAPVRATATADPARLVALPDPEHVLSKTHAEVRVERGAVYAVDRGSKNRTFVTLPGSETQVLDPEVAVPIVPGTTIDLAGAVLVHYRSRTA